MKSKQNRVPKRMILAALVALTAVLVIPTTTLAASKIPKYQAGPKNVIIMISDGCGYNQITATDYYQYGKTGKQVYEKFPTKVAMSTYEYEKDANGNPVIYGYDTKQAWTDFGYVDFHTEPNNTTDSASAATAMSTGVKTYNGSIGVDITGAPLRHIAQYAEARGKATGVITTVEFSHATPAGFVAHNISRNNYADIANEMIYNSATDVIMGCGAPDYDDSGKPQDPTGKEKYVGGPATWADLTDDGSVMGADADGDGDSDAWTAIRDRADFQALARGATPSRVIGIPNVYTTLQQSRGGDGFATPYNVPLTETVPTLKEMTQAALNVLDNDRDGFFLMIEGGAVDWADHANQSGRMIEEEIDFNRAVEAVVDWVKKKSNWGETLVIVTGDHECGYLTGPGSNPTWKPIVNNGRGNLPGMEWHSDEHTNSLIPFFAKGDSAQLFKARADERDIIRGSYLDNTEIAKVIIGLWH